MDPLRWHFAYWWGPVKEGVGDAEGRENQINKAPEVASRDPEPQRHGGCSGEDVCFCGADAGRW